VKGGIKELIKHYENDVFGRRNKLMKKCQHLQKIIDQYVELRLPGDRTKNKRQCIKEELEKENQTCEKAIKIDENISLKEKTTEMESTTDTFKTETQSITEENKIDAQSTTGESVCANIDDDQTEYMDLENTNIKITKPNNFKMVIDPKSIENIKNNVKKLKEKKSANSKFLDNFLPENKEDYDLLKPLLTESDDFNIESGISKNLEESLCEHEEDNQYKNVFKTINSNSPRKFEIWNSATPKCSLDPSILDAISIEMQFEEEVIKKKVEEMENEFKLCEATHPIKINISEIMKSDSAFNNLFYNNFELFQKNCKDSDSDTNQTCSPNKMNSVQSIPVNENEVFDLSNLLNDPSDIVPILSNSSTSGSLDINEKI